MFSSHDWISAPDVIEDIWQKLTSDIEEEHSIEDLRDKTAKEFTNFLGFCDSAAVMSPSGDILHVGKSFLRQVFPDGKGHRLFSFGTGLVRTISDPKEQILQMTLTDKPFYIKFMKETHFKIGRLLHYALLSFFITLGCLAVVQVILSFSGMMDIQKCGLPCFEALPINFWRNSFWKLGLTLGLATISSLTAVRLLGVISQQRIEEQDHLYQFEGFSVIFSTATVTQFLNLEDDITAASKGSETAVAKKIVSQFDQGLRFKRSDVQSSIGNHLTARGFGRAWDMARHERPQLGKPGRKGRI